MSEAADVVRAARVLADAGQGDLVWGHVAVRDAAGRGCWMKPAGLGLEEVGPEDAVLVGWDGEVLEGHRDRHLEYPIHTEVMRARDEVAATVHTHPEHAVVFGALGVPLVPAGHEATAFVPPDLPRYSVSSDLIRTADQGRAVAEVLGSGRATLLVNHGIVTAGRNVGEAVLAAILLETACRKAVAALATGLPIPPLDEEEALAKRAHIYSAGQIEQAWRYLCRRAQVDQGNEGPG